MIDLAAIAASLVPQGKGFLANDEKIAHATAYLAEHGIEGGPEMRRKYRSLFLETPGIEKFLSGAILFEGTYDEKGDDGTLFPKSLVARGIAPGVTVDEGLDPLPGSEEETVTKGLIGLPDCLHTYRDKGAVFTKWRAAYVINGDRFPSKQALHENSRRLATYAKDAQSAGLVPVVEVEVLLSGDHPRARAAAASAEALSTLFSIIDDHAVDCGGLILKTSMVLAGSASARKDSPDEVGEETIAVLMKQVPRSVAGVVFLSGGQASEQATENLAAITRAARTAHAPWPLTFSFARAFQDEALAIWKGKEENVPQARGAFLARLSKAASALA